MANILSKADIQNYAPELDLSAYSDPTISGMLSQATNRAAQFCSVKGFDFTTETDETDRAVISNDGDLVISVRRRPIVAVSSISLVKGLFSTSLTLTDSSGNFLYQIPYPGNKIVLPNSYLYMTGTFLAGGSSQLLTLKGANVFYKITYTGGNQTIPDDLKYAVSLYFRDIYQKQFNTRGLNSFNQGSYSESYIGMTSSKGRSAYVLEAEDVLMNGNFRRVEF